MKGSKQRSRYIGTFWFAGYFPNLTHWDMIALYAEWRYELNYVRAVGFEYTLPKLETSVLWWLSCDLVGDGICPTRMNYDMAGVPRYWYLLAVCPHCKVYPFGGN